MTLRLKTESEEDSRNRNEQRKLYADTLKTEQTAADPALPRSLGPAAVYTIPFDLTCDPEFKAGALSVAPLYDI